LEICFVCGKLEMLSAIGGPIASLKNKRQPHPGLDFYICGKKHYRS
jgi:hypothetical protein